VEFRPRKQNRTSTRGDGKDGPNGRSAVSDVEGRDRDSWLMQACADISDEWRKKMERVSRETQDAIARRDEEPESWFDPEYHAFIERGE